MARIQAIEARPRLSTGLVAGFVAGIVGGLGSIVAGWALRVSFPPLSDTAWSAFFAGLVGGPLYIVLVGAVRRPASVLWALTLGVATVDSLLIAVLPLPAGPGPAVGIPIQGLIIPVAQLGALLGLGHFGTTHFPVTYLPADAVLHYIPAVAVAVLVPRWAKNRRALLPRGRHRWLSKEPR